MMAEPQAVVLPQAVLPEICYLVSSRLGSRAEVEFLRATAESDWQLEPLESRDLARVVELVEAYSEAAIGFVDAAVVALAERLGITRIYTLDRRHFGLVRPAHAEAFEVLP